MNPADTDRTPSPSHRFLAHTGEIRLHLHAPSLADLLAEAGRALSTLLLRASSQPSREPWRDVTVSSSDREGLLVDWLNELIYRAETDLEVATEFDIRQVSDTGVDGRIRGIRVATPPALVKAATYHGVRIAPAANGLEADVILDV